MGETAAVIAFVVCACLVSAGAKAEEPKPLARELVRLESHLEKDTLSAAERQRLAEIYFLTSRCKDVGKILAKDNEHEARTLKCACGGACAPGSEDGQVHRFKRLLERGAKWKSPGVQKLWRSVRAQPEARYWAMRALSRQRNAVTQGIRADLEASLESLDVKP